MKIKIAAYLFIFFNLLACHNSPQANTSEVSNIDSIKNPIPFTRVKHLNQGLILAKEITLYDIYKNPIKTIKIPYGEVITIDSISRDKFALTNDSNRCNLHNFVKVNGPSIKGWIYGKNIFENELKGRDTSFTMNEIQFKIIPTRNFNIGVYDEVEEALSACDMTYSPILFYNSKYNKYEYLPILDENYSENLLTLDDHDGWLDKIKSTSFQDDVLTLNIYREYQEGSAEIVVTIQIDKQLSKAKLLSIVRQEV